MQAVILDYLPWRLLRVICFLHCGIRYPTYAVYGISKMGCNYSLAMPTCFVVKQHLTKYLLYCMDLNRTQYLFNENTKNPFALNTNNKTKIRKIKKSRTTTRWITTLKMRSVVIGTSSCRICLRFFFSCCFDCLAHCLEMIREK